MSTNMVTHTCPICSRTHEVREVRAALAYGRQLTCSPDCESERRKRMRRRPAGEQAASTLHTWVVATTAADLVRVSGLMRAARRR
jgi:hypothetical protein